MAFAQTMRVYEAKLSYNLVEDGDDVHLDKPEKVVAYLKSGIEVYPMQETFWVIMLSRKNRALGRVCISLGSATATMAHPREVYRPAILANACAVIVAHNHPSGDPAPSAPDMQVTRLLREASRAIDIELIDHVIVGDPKSDPTGRGYFSFRAAGLL